jgi:phosphoribosylglycinamide formyltransferase 1
MLLNNIFLATQRYKQMIRLAIFASGEGSNAQRFINYFKGRNDISVSLIVSGNPKAKVIERAIDAGIPHLIIEKDSFYQTNEVIAILKQKVDFIVLAGFMWMVPINLIKTFSGKIVNIHPALLPKYGGKGMYGSNVHKAVIANKEKKSGITVHYVNEQYDEGKIIYQAECKVEDLDTPETLANRVHALEHEHYPVIVERLLLGNIS